MDPGPKRICTPAFVVGHYALGVFVFAMLFIVAPMSSSADPHNETLVRENSYALSMPTKRYIETMRSKCDAIKSGVERFHCIGTVMDIENRAYNVQKSWDKLNETMTQFVSSHQ